MRYVTTLTLLILVSARFSYAQTQPLVLKGILKAKADSTPLRNATVRLASPVEDSLKRSVLTDQNGAFQITGLKAQPYIITISYLGYAQLERAIMLQNETQDLGTIMMSKSSRELQEVVIKGQIPPTQQKGDTLQYNADAFKTNPDASGEDLVRKMPGIVVENGTVKAHGEEVRKVLVDGKEFFGDDATLALRNLPADVISKIEVFDRMSDQAQFTGFDDGNSVKTINIVTRAEMRQGQFGKLFAGYGTDDRYSAGGNVNIFDGDRRISLIGMANNVNQQNFSSQDLLGVMGGGGGGFGGRGGRGGGGGRGGFGGMGGGGFGGGGGNFLVGNQSGLNKTNSIGINFNDNFGSKVTFNGSYFFNNSNSSNEQISRLQTTLPDGSLQVDNDSAMSTSRNYNHRFNMRVEYKIDSANTIIFTPGISFQKNNSFSESIGSTYLMESLVSQNSSDRTSYNSGYNFNGNLMYRHAFAKRGRTISLSIGGSSNDRNGETLSNSNLFYARLPENNDSLHQQVLPVSDGHSINANIAYTEPIGKMGQLQINYNPTWSKSYSDRRAYEYDPQAEKYRLLDTTMSNMYNTAYNTQSAGLTYRLGNRDKMLSFGVSYQYAELSGDQVFPVSAQVHQRFNNILPNAMLMAKTGTYGRIRLFYRASTNQPSVQQLQDVYNPSDLQNISVGNSALKQQYGHMVAARYNYTNTSTGHNFFANVFLQQTNDYVSNATFIAQQDSVLTPTLTLKQNARLTKPVNLDGFVSARTVLTYGLPVKFIKSNFNLTAGVGYSRMPSMINNVTSTTDNINYNLGWVLSSNISEYVDFNVNYSANINKVTNTLDVSGNSNYFTHVFGVSANLLSKSGWVLQNELNNQLTSGLGTGFNQSYWLWNMSAGKKFLKNKRAELRASVFDLLKQNRSIVRIVDGLTITDQQSQVLTQYFMLTFTYRLRNFGKPQQRQSMQRRSWGGMPGSF